MAQNSDHLCLEIHFSSNSGPSQDFRTKKSGPSQDFDTWLIFRAEINEKLNGSNFGISCICLHVSRSPSMTFWAISGYPPYFAMKLLHQVYEKPYSHWSCCSGFSPALIGPLFKAHDWGKWPVYFIDSTFLKHIYGSDYQKYRAKSKLKVMRIMWKFQFVIGSWYI